MRALLLALALAACGPDPSTRPIEPYDALALVDPMIGTGGKGVEVIGLNPGAAVPFGFVQVGPDSRHSRTGQPGFYHFGGYHYDDDLVDGFGHTHANGMGVNDLGGVVVFPRARWDARFVSGPARALPLDHARESASPGAYGITLGGDEIDVRIAATPRGAVHTWRFPAGSAPVVIFDLAYTLGNVEIPEASIAADGARIVGEQVVKGGYSARFGGIRHHFVAEVEPAPTTGGTWSDAAGLTEATEAAGTGVGAWIGFPEGTTEVTMRVALSPVSPSGAASNFEAEVAGRDLDAVHADAEAAWRDILGTVKVRGGTEDERVIFHTALYHAFLWPNLYQDADGTYLGFDREEHASDRPYHSAFSLWDTFRTTHPLFTLAIPERHEDMLHSLVLMAEQGGSLPRWPLGHGYTGGMIGSPGAIVLAEAHLKGLDAGGEAAFDHAVAGARGPTRDASRAGIEAYRALGWVPHDQVGGAASRTLEYAWADHALARWADDLGRDDVLPELEAQAGHWANTWDAEAGFFVGRNADGTFNDEYNPEAWSSDFVEGSAWNYVFGVPFDVDGMIETQDGGDRDAFLGRLDAFWDAARAEEDDFLFDSYYWHGNEPDLHYAFLASLAGDRERTVEAARWVMATRYDTTPEGLDGNDDAGTLSAWYVLAACGLYPVAGTPTYALGAPIFERVELPGLTIRAERLADGSNLREVWLGDRRVEGGTVEHAELMAAGELIFVFGP